MWLWVSPLEREASVFAGLFSLASWSVVTLTMAHGAGTSMPDQVTSLSALLTKPGTAGDFKILLIFSPQIQQLCVQIE